jgi:hypothetical protein
VVHLGSEGDACGHEATRASFSLFGVLFFSSFGFVCFFFLVSATSLDLFPTTRKNFEQEMKGTQQKTPRKQALSTQLHTHTSFSCINIIC